jgi:Na+/H+ antiporter NhaD/arsenite permease-like protein
MRLRHPLASLLVLAPAGAWATTPGMPGTPAAATGPALASPVAHPVGVAAVALFVLAYALVVLEERLHLSKSKPVMAAAGLIWLLIAGHAAVSGQSALASAAFEHVFLEFAQLFFFLVVAMSFVSAMGERNLFEAMRAELTRRGLGYRALFWLTGLLAFFISPVLDNLTCALIMSAVILAVANGNARFTTLAFINVVVAANAGGAWSAFGDITTLMVWQARRVDFFEFFVLFLPSLVNWLVPAAIMAFAVPAGAPAARPDDAGVKYGGWLMCALFALTIAITVAAKQLLHMPAVFGMLCGLAMLKLQGHAIARRERLGGEEAPYNIFRIIEKAEWDTLLFFYGVLACVGGLATLGYMELASGWLYGGFGPTWANVALGLLSAIVDNIPIMYAVLRMEPAMDHGQWLLITLTCGVGGSLLSVGSAAGVALMGVSKGQYTFMGHLRWTWAVALGFAASIATHLWLNAHLFTAHLPTGAME